MAELTRIAVDDQGVVTFTYDDGTSVVQSEADPSFPATEVEQLDSTE